MYPKFGQEIQKDYPITNTKIHVLGESIDVTHDIGEFSLGLKQFVNKTLRYLID